MNGDVGENCDGHPYTPELAAALKDAFRYLEKAAYVVEFHEQDEYNLLLHRTDTDLYERRRFYGAVRNDPRKKVFVGPARLHQVCKMLRTEFVEVPVSNAYAAYAHVRDRILDVATPDAIFLFSAGLPAKVWIADVLEHNPNVTCLDTGSAFDPVFLWISRTYQERPEVLVELYRDWIYA